MIDNSSTSLRRLKWGCGGCGDGRRVRAAALWGGYVVEIYPLADAVALTLQSLSCLFQELKPRGSQKSAGSLSFD